MPQASWTIENTKGSGRRVTSILAGLALVALETAALGTGDAQATPARFTYEVCDSALPGGGSSTAKYAGGAAFTGVNNCSSPGGGLGIQETANSTGEFSFWSVGIPATPGGFVESLAISAEACGLSPANDDTFVYEGQPHLWPGNSCIESQRVFHIRDALPTTPFNVGAGFSIVMNCNVNKGPCPPGPAIVGHYFAATEVDVNPPTVSDLNGSLLDGGPIRGRQGLAADLADKGGGLSGAEALVNGVSAGKPLSENCSVASAKNPSIVGAVAEATTPCPTSDKVEWNLDTQSYPFHDGANTVAVCASDFATLGEPNRVCTPPRTVQVDNSCTAAAVDGGELLSAQFNDSHRDSVTVAYGHPETVSGRLATNAGDPVRGAALCVKMATLGVDARPVTVGTVTTDTNGEYSYELPAGPNRQLVIGYRFDAHQLARDVHYYAHVRPSLKRAPGALRNGKRVHLWGQLPGPRAGGRVVVLQANAPGSKRWITFRRATTGGAGTFKSGYHFTSTTRKTRYRFRAVVPRQAGYPWIEGHSKPATVTVKP